MRTFVICIVSAFLVGLGAFGVRAHAADAPYTLVAWEITAGPGHEVDADQPLITSAPGATTLDALDTYLAANACGKYVQLDLYRNEVNGVPVSSLWADGSLHPNHDGGFLAYDLLPKPYDTREIPACDSATPSAEPTPSAPSTPTSPPVSESSPVPSETTPVSTPTPSPQVPSPSPTSAPSPSPTYSPPVLNCGPDQVPGWLNEHGDPTSCVSNDPRPEDPPTSTPTVPAAGGPIAEPTPKPTASSPTTAGSTPSISPSSAVKAAAGTSPAELAYTGANRALIPLLILGLTALSAGIALHIRAARRSPKDS